MIFSKNKTKKKEHDKQYLLDQYPLSSRFAESYRTLRTNLFFTVMEKELKSVIVTSSVEGEGKTTTSINLAHAIAQTDRKVLLMDADLRRPHLSSLFGMRQESGISEIVVETFGTHLTHGNLANFSINDLIQLIKLQKRTCCLNLENDETQVELFFEKGHMVDIYWKNRPEAKKLANSLIRDNLLTKEEATLALGHQKKSIQRLGTILYSMGFVNKENIARALSIHTIEAIKAVSAMETGQFAFSVLGADEIKNSLAQNADFEKLYAEFTISGDQGNFLKNAIEKAIKSTKTPNLFVMPSGAAPPNPSDLVGSERTGYLISYLKNRFDFIIIDTPPVIPATDALQMTSWTDGTILVIKSGNTDRKIIKNAVNQLKTAKQPIIGTVLNQVDMKKEGYYRYYKKYYSSYYGQ